MLPSELEASRRFADLGRLRVHYLEAGDLTAPLVILLHGFPESSWTWRHQIRPLVDAGFRVVAPDSRGSNDSSTEGPFGLGTLATDVRQLLHHLGREKAHLVGHGWGGAVAWQLAAYYPASVDRLVLLSAPHPSTWREALWNNRASMMRAWPALLAHVPVLAETGLKHFGERALTSLYKRMAHDFENLSEVEVEPLVQALKKPGVARAMVGWQRAALKHVTMSTLMPSRFPRVDSETLLVWGAEDVLFPQTNFAEKTRALVPALKTTKVEGAGHFLHVERPLSVAQVLVDFLESGRSVEMLPAPEAASHVWDEEASDSAARVLADAIHREDRAVKEALEAKKKPSAVLPMAYTVILSDPGENKIAVIKEIRDITGLAVKGARDLVENTPKTITSAVTEGEAERIRKQLTDIGARVLVQPLATARA